MEILDPVGLRLLSDTGFSSLAWREGGREGGREMELII